MVGGHVEGENHKIRKNNLCKHCDVSVKKMVKEDMKDGDVQWSKYFIS